MDSISADSTDLHWAHDTSCLCNFMTSDNIQMSAFVQITSNNECNSFTSMVSTSKIPTEYSMEPRRKVQTVKREIEMLMR